MPNFVKIGQNAAEIWLFLIFQDGGRRHLGFLKFQIFNGRNGQGDRARAASSSQISSKSVELRLKFFDFSKMAAVAILDL